MMNALPLFPQSPTPSGATGLAAGGLSAMTGEGESANFGALLQQNGAVALASATATATTMVPAASLAGVLTSADPATGTAVDAAPANGANSGRFENVNVILQLLRASQALADGSVADGATLSDSTDVTPQSPAATPLSGLNPSDLNLGGLNKGAGPSAKLPDFLAQLLPQLLPQPKTTPPADGLNLEHTGAATTSANLLAAAMQKLSGDTKTKTTPADQGAATLSGAVSDGETTTDQISTAADGSEILLALTQAPAPAVPAQSLPSLSALAASLPTTAAPLPEGEEALDGQVTADAGPFAGNSRQKTAFAPTASQPSLSAQNQNTGSDPVQLGTSRTANAQPSVATLTNTAAAPSPLLVSSSDQSAAMSVLIQAPSSTGNSAPLLATSNAAPVTEKWLDMGSDDVWIGQLAKDIAAAKSATGDINFRLMPRHLGRLDVSMMQGDDGVSVRMDAQHEVTASLVMAAQGRLVDELRQQGVRVTAAEVTHTPHDAGRQNGSGQGRSGQSDVKHFIETASDRLPETTRDDKASADRRGRFA